MSAKNLAAKSTAGVDKDGRRRSAHRVGSHRLRKGPTSGVGRIDSDRKPNSILVQKRPQRFDFHRIVMFKHSVKTHDDQRCACKQVRDPRLFLSLPRSA